MTPWPGMALPLLLLLLSLRASALTVRNCSSVMHIAKPRELSLEWILPSPHRYRTCLLTLHLAFTTKLEISYFSGSGIIYQPTTGCYNKMQHANQDWDCEHGCQGLFYSKSLHSPRLAISLQQPLKLQASTVRLLYCHLWESTGHYTDVEFVISSDERSSDNYQDPVWRVLGPVLATVCMVATVFLVCVCYVQHAYQRGQPRCCKWICDWFRGAQPPEAEAQSGQGEAGHVHSAHRHIDPLTDMPPAYDDFRKYHRPCSFGEADRQRQAPMPPSYMEAVQSLEQEELQQRARTRTRSSVRRSLSCGANADVGAATDGVDNPAFLREDAAPPAFSEEPERLTSAVSAEDLTIEMDLGDGQNGTRPGASNC